MCTRDPRGSKWCCACWSSKPTPAKRSSKPTSARWTSLTCRTGDEGECLWVCSCGWTLTPSRTCCARYAHWTRFSWNCAPDWTREPRETCSAPEPNNPGWTSRLKPSWTRLSRASGSRLTWVSSGTKWWIQSCEPCDTPWTCESRACGSCRSSEDWICKWRCNPSRVSARSL